MRKGLGKKFSFQRIPSTNLSTFSISNLVCLSDVGGVQEGGLTDVAIEVLHRLLSHVIHGPRDQVGVGDDQVSAFMETLKKGLCHKFLFVHVCTTPISKLYWSVNENLQTASHRGTFWW